MPKKGLGGMYPSTFCEWVVGTTIESALESRAKKQAKQREIVKVEVTTDDETEEDSLRITYPRSGRSTSSPQTTGTVVKKVRFQETPKSALKKVTVVSESSEASDSDAASQSEQDTDEPESSDEPAKKPPKSKKSKKSSSNSDSEADSDPHPTCKCTKCARGREKLKKHAKGDKQSAPSDSEPSDSEPDSAPKAKNQDAAKSKKGGNKGKEKNGEKPDAKASESEADDEASGSAKTTEDEADDKSKKKGPEKKQESKQGGKEKQQNNKDDSQKGNKNQDKAKAAKASEAGKANSDAKSAKANGAPQEPAEDPEKTADAPKKRGKHGTGKKMGVYPEAFLAPHPRRPQLIEPIRAEVVQTEKVVETPEDPPPNAYYDPQHGVLRVYYGQVYGGRQSYALYPRRDASGRPLPVGMPHPTQNPYYYGFNQPPPQQAQQGQEHVPITQGMPVPAWNAMCPPPGMAPEFAPGFAPGNLGSFPQSGPPAVWPDANANANANPNPNPNGNGNGNRGAFSMCGNGESPHSKLRDKSGANNVVPGSVKNNPYYPKRNISQFSTYGSRVPSNASQRHVAPNAPGANPASNGPSGNDGAGDTNQPPANGMGGGNSQGWDNADQQASQDTNGNQNQSQGWDNQTNNGQAATWDAGANSNHNGGWNDGNYGQRNGSGNDNGNWAGSNNGCDAHRSGWGNDGAGAANGSGWDNTQEAQHGHSANSGGGANFDRAAEASNVMPGTFPASGGAPEWGDLTAAASTGGRVDEQPSGW